MHSTLHTLYNVHCTVKYLNLYSHIAIHSTIYMLQLYKKDTFQICLFQYPVLISLILSRRPGFFQFHLLCKLWRIMFKALQRLSVYLVLLLSVTRTISLCRPLMTISKSVVLGLFAGYICLIALEIGVLSSREKIKYWHDACYCYEWDNWKTWFNKIGSLLYITCLGCSSVIIFVSFLISVFVIRNSMKTDLYELDSSRLNPLKKHATHTIMIFTFTYIICNIPHFINMIVFLYDIVTVDVYGAGDSLYTSTFMFYYFWNLTEVLSVVINSTCNPIIYYLRIAHFKAWIKDLPCIKKLVDSRVFKHYR